MPEAARSRPGILPVRCFTRLSPNFRSLAVLALALVVTTPTLAANGRSNGRLERQTGCELLFAAANDTLASHCECKDYAQEDYAGLQLPVAQIEQLVCTPEDLGQFVLGLAQMIASSSSSPSVFQVNYMSISTDLCSASRELPVFESDRSKSSIVLNVDHVAMELRRAACTQQEIRSTGGSSQMSQETGSNTEPEVTRPDETVRRIERGMIDFVGLINETHLQFVSLVVAPSPDPEWLLAEASADRKSANQKLWPKQQQQQQQQRQQKAQLNRHKSEAHLPDQSANTSPEGQIGFEALLSRLANLARLELSLGTPDFRSEPLKLVLRGDTFARQAERLKWLSLASNADLSFEAPLEQTSKGNHDEEGARNDQEPQIETNEKRDQREHLQSRSRSPFERLGQLEFLSLESSGLQSFPLAFHFGARYEEADGSTVLGLPKLATLNLASNKLRSFEADLFGSGNFQGARNSLAQGNKDGGQNFKYSEPMGVVQEFHLHLDCGTSHASQNVANSNSHKLAKTARLQLPALTQLDLSSNELRDFTFRAGQCLLSTMPNLSQLYLQHNRIHHLNLNSLLTFPIGTLPEPLLSGLDIPSGGSNADVVPSSNQITSARGGVQQILFSQLEHIDLSYNQLAMLTGLVPYESLTMPNNGMPPQLQPSPPRLRSINLSFNRLYRPMTHLDRRLLNRILFKESFDLIGSRKLSTPDSLASSHIEAQFVALDAIEGSFVVTGSVSEGLKSNQTASLCDFASPAVSSWQNSKQQQSPINDLESSLLVEIVLDNNRLGPRLSNSDFGSSQCRDVQTLRLSRNNIVLLEPGSLNNLLALEHLDLSHNLLNNLPDKLLARNSKLRYLNLAANKLTKLAKHAFAQLSDLEELILAQNELNELPAELLTSSPRLQVLNLSRNKLTHIEGSSFSHMKYLVELDLSHNQLDKFTQQHNGFLRSLSSSVGSQNLPGYTAKITSLAPSSLWPTSSLPQQQKSLNLSSLPSASSSKNSVKTSEKRRNNKPQRTSVKETKSTKTRYGRQVDMTSNNIESMYEPAEVGSYASLTKSLNLNANQIATFTLDPGSTTCNGSYVTEFLRSLERLSLANNRLIELSSGSFECLNSLKELDLSSNQIRNIDAGALSNLRHLNSIDLSNNQLSRLPAGSLFNPGSIQNRLAFRLNLSRNKLVDFDFHGAFGGLTTMEEISRGGKPSLQVELINMCDNHRLKVDGNELASFLKKVSARELRLCNIEQIRLLSRQSVSSSTVQESSSNTTEFGPNLDVNSHSLTLLNIHSVKFIDENFLSSKTSMLVPSLTGLRSLDLSFTRLPLGEDLIYLLAEIMRRGLSSLNLAGNQYLNSQIASLFANISSTGGAQINSLNMSSNRIEFWPFDNLNSTRISLSQLRQLDLSKNKLRHFVRDETSQKQEFKNSQLGSLEELNLSFNSITGLVEHPTLRTKGLLNLMMPKIHSLDLSHNRLTWIPFQFFDDLVHLRSLNLAHNQLEMLPFVLSTNLRISLDLSYNHKLRSLKLDPFSSQDNSGGAISVQSSEPYPSMLDDSETSEVILYDPDENEADAVTVPRKLVCKQLDDFIHSRPSSSSSSNGNDPKILPSRSSLIDTVTVDSHTLPQQYDRKCLQLISTLETINLDSISPQVNLNLLQFDPSKIVHLTLRNNALNQLNLTEERANIISLDLADNLLQNLSIPLQICKYMPEIRSLSLSKNQLKSIYLYRYDQARCLMLNYLNLSFNKISSWPFIEPNEYSIEAVDPLGSLLVLDLSHNYLSHLEGFLESKSMRSLMFLDLTSNPLKHLDTKLRFASKRLSLTIRAQAPQDDLFSSDRPTIKIEDSLIQFNVKKSSNFSLSMYHVNQRGNHNSALLENQVPQSIQFCTLQSRSIYMICLSPLGSLNFDQCVYLKRPPNISSCLTSLQDVRVNDSRISDSNLDRQFIVANSINGDSEEETSKSNGTDPVLKFIDLLKRNWIRLKEFDLNYHLATISRIDGNSVLMEINGKYPIYSLTLIKMSIVGGCICIVSLLIAMFNLLTCTVQHKRGHHPSPGSGSEFTSSLTNDTSETGTSVTTMHNKISISESCSSANQGATTSTSSTASSKSSGFKKSSSLQTIKEVKLDNLDAADLLAGQQYLNQCLPHCQQLQYSQHPPQLNCSTPSSSLAPSSIETAETLQAVDSIQSGSSFINGSSNRSSVDHYSHDSYTSSGIYQQQQQVQQPVATVMRMIKSNSSSCGFDRQSNLMSVNNGNRQIYGTLKAKMRSTQGHQNHLNQPIRVPADLGTSGAGMKASGAMPEIEYDKFAQFHRQEKLSNRTDQIKRFSDSGISSSMLVEQDQATMSLMSITSALAEKNSIVSGQPTNASSDDFTQPDLCHYHRLFNSQTDHGMPSTIILEQQEEDDLTLMSPMPPPTSLAIEAIEGRARVQFEIHNPTDSKSQLGGSGYYNRDS